MLLRDSSNTTRQSATDNRVKAIVAHFYNNSITMTPDIVPTNWATIEVIPTASTTIPTAVLSLNTSTGVISVTQVGTAAGFIIRNSTGIVVVKCYFCEGKGNNYNNITYNVYSGNNSYNEQPKFFRITNIVILDFWKDSFRKGKTYNLGYSSVVNISENLVINGDCSNFPRTADGYETTGLQGAVIENSNLKITTTHTSGFVQYIIGRKTVNTVFTQGFYKFIVTPLTAFEVALSTDVIIWGSAGDNLALIKPRYADVKITALSYFILAYRFPYYGIAIFDKIEIYRVTHPHDVLVPAHEIQQGKDAMLYNLTNPA